MNIFYIRTIEPTQALYWNLFTVLSMLSNSFNWTDTSVV